MRRSSGPRKTLGAPGLELETWYIPTLGAPGLAFETGVSSKPALIVVLFVLASLTSCRSHDFPQYPPNYREYAYVTNGDSGTVTVLDVVNVRVDREVPVGQNPVAVTASPTRNEVYVVNSGAKEGLGSLSVIDAEKNAVAATIALHRKPVSIDLN